MSSGKKTRTSSFVKMQERAVQETSVKDLINKYNTGPKSGTKKLRNIGGYRKTRKGTKRRGSALLAVPTNITHDDPEVTNSKSAKETEILLKLEQQQAQFQKMLEEQKAEKEALEARLRAAETNLADAKNQTAAQADAARNERLRIEELLAQQNEQLANNVASASQAEKEMEAQYNHTVKVRRASAALVGRALLGGALGGKSNFDMPEPDTDVVAAVPSPRPPLPNKPKPPEPPESDSESSSSLSSSSGDEDSDSDDDYAANMEEIMSKPVEECTPIERAARLSAMSEDEIPPLLSLIPEFTEDPEGLLRFLHAPVPYEQGIVQCELHRKGKCFYFLLGQTEEYDTRFLMFAQDRSGFGAANIMISMVANGKRNDPSFLGKVRGNVLNTKYVAFDNGVHPTQTSTGIARCEKAFVNYVLKDEEPRQMCVVTPTINPDGSVPVFRQSTDRQDLLEELYKMGDASTVHFSENKQPKWDRKLQCYVLDFKKRATKASVKNFLLVTKEDPDHDSILFGKKENDEFNVDVQYPMSFFQAFAVCLSAIYAKSAPSL